MRKNILTALGFALVLLASGPSQAANMGFMADQAMSRFTDQDAELFNQAAGKAPIPHIERRHTYPEFVDRFQGHGPGTRVGTRGDARAEEVVGRCSIDKDAIEAEVLAADRRSPSEGLAGEREEAGEIPVEQRDVARLLAGDDPARPPMTDVARGRCRDRHPRQLGGVEVVQGDFDQDPVPQTG